MAPSNRIVFVPLTLLPLFLCLGAAGQAIGLYLFAFLIPVIAAVTTGQTETEAQESEKSWAFRVRHLGFDLLVLHLIFVFANVVNMLEPAPDILARFSEPHAVPYKFLLQSEFSSTFFFVGCGLVTISFFMNEVRSEHLARRFCESFHKGFLGASFLLLCYVLYQVKTGFDYRAPHHLLSSDHRLVSGWYRAFGLFGHPLSLAGFALAVFAFYSHLLGATFRKEGRLRSDFALIAFIHFLFVVLSGGRSAQVVSLVLFAVVAWRSTPSQLKRKMLVSFLTVFAAMCIGLYFLGFFTRYKEFLTLSPVQEGRADRILFWQAHWKMFIQRPLFGNGHAFLDAFRRIDYYDAFGMSGLHDKFNAHNFYLECLADIGIFGVGVIAAGCYFIFKNLKSIASNSSPIVESLVHAFVFSVVANALHGFTQNTFFDTHVTMFYMSTLLLIVWCGRERAETSPGS